MNSNDLTISKILQLAKITLINNNANTNNNFDSIKINGIASLSAAKNDQITFCLDKKFLQDLQNCQAAAIVLPPNLADFCPQNSIALIVKNPYADFAKIANVFYPPNYALKNSPQIAENVSIGKNVEIGENSYICSGGVLQDNVKIGKNCILYSNVVVYHGCQIGDNCIIHAGACIGADGFGFAPDGDSWVKIPQLGRAILGNNVEFGANSCVDRGTFDDTIIGDGCKIDNLIHIGHNCKIGKNCVMAACTGIAGSVEVGDHCVFGGASMISGHLKIAANTTISGGTLVMKSIKESDNRYTSVFPLETHEKWIQNASHIRRLDKMAKKINELEKLVEQLQNK